MEERGLGVLGLTHLGKVPFANVDADSPLCCKSCCHCQVLGTTRRLSTRTECRQIVVDEILSQNILSVFMLPFMPKVMACMPKMLASTLTRSIFCETRRAYAAMAAGLRIYVCAYRYVRAPHSNSKFFVSLLLE